MSLAQIWKSNPEQLQKKSVQQILGFAGDGLLKDGNATSVEFRELLAHVPSDILSSFANHCLDSPFKESGLALQDIVNQVGKRLGFQIQPGKYRGTSAQDSIGFDGLWTGSGGFSIIVEVKTTDTYRMSLDVVANYRRKLVVKNEISEEKSSILYIVGRNDTGDLEAQVRGSRHAWDIRLISIDSLLRLMELKEELEDPKIVEKIRDVLIPREYTRVDGIIELVFSAASEVKKDEGDAADVELISGVKSSNKAKKFTPVTFRKDCIERISKNLGETLVRRTSAIFSTPDEKLGVSCAISREYDSTTSTNYWFAFHPTQQASLQQFEKAFVCFGCGSADHILKVPRDVFFSWLPLFNKTVDGDREYWHVHIYKSLSGWVFHAKAGGQKIEASEYYLKQPSA